MSCDIPFYFIFSFYFLKNFSLLLFFVMFIFERESGGGAERESGRSGSRVKQMKILISSPMMSSVTLGKFSRLHFLNIVSVVRNLGVPLGEF